MVDVLTAERHGVCPECEGYGGRADDDECQQEDSTCTGSCPKCWCPGCHDGAVDCEEPESGERMGSWEAYRAVQDLDVAADQLALGSNEEEERA